MLQTQDPFKPFHYTAFALAVGALLAMPATMLADDDDDHEAGGALVEELILGGSPHVSEAGEFGLTFHIEHLAGDEENTTDYIAEFSYGLTDTIELALEVPFNTIDGKEGEGDEDGIGDLGVGVLWNFHNDDGLVLTASGEASFTTGDEDKELGEEDAEYEIALLGAWRLDDIELYGGVGGEFTDDDEAFTYSAGVAVPLGPVVGLAEVAGSDGGDGEEDEAFFAPGIAFELVDDVAVTLGAPIGLNDHSADWGLTARIAFEF